MPAQVRTLLIARPPFSEPRRLMSFVLLRSVVGTSCLDGTPVSQHRALAVGRPHSGHQGFSDFLKSWCLKRIAEFRYPHFPAGLYPLTGEVTKFGHFTDFPVFRRGNGCSARVVYFNKINYSFKSGNRTQKSATDPRRQFL